MKDPTMSHSIHCACGQVVIALSGEPIISCECHCNSCRDAADRMGTLPGAAPVQAANGGTPYVLYRKDRVRVMTGAEQLREFRLTPDSHTRRVVASCCNTPLFTEFKDGHWLSLFASLWPESSRPAMEMRTMTSDLPAGVTLDDTLPNAKRQSGGFIAKLLWAWVAMGFRVPRVEVAGELKL